MSTQREALRRKASRMFIPTIFLLFLPDCLPKCLPDVIFRQLKYIGFQFFALSDSKKARGDNTPLALYFLDAIPWYLRRN